MIINMIPAALRDLHGYSSIGCALKRVESTNTVTTQSTPTKWRFLTSYLPEARTCTCRCVHIRSAPEQTLWQASGEARLESISEHSSPTAYKNKISIRTPSSNSSTLESSNLALIRSQADLSFGRVGYRGRSAQILRQRVQWKAGAQFDENWRHHLSFFLSLYFLSSK